MRTNAYLRRVTMNHIIIRALLVTLAFELEFTIRSEYSFAISCACIDKTTVQILNDQEGDGIFQSFFAQFLLICHILLRTMSIHILSRSHMGNQGYRE